MTTCAAPADPPRRGDWILTRCGRRFYPLDPRAADVELEDIAYALAHQCRWTGHVRWHYSVAQHAVAVAALVERFSPTLALAALHHDDAEAYLGDWSRPVKRSVLVQRATPCPRPADTAAMIAALPEPIAATEERILGVIFQALAIPDPGLRWEVIRVADDLVLHQEKRVLLPADAAPGWDRLGRPPRGIRLPRISPDEARAQFLACHERLWRQHRTEGRP